MEETSARVAEMENQTRDEGVAECSGSREDKAEEPHCVGAGFQRECGIGLMYRKPVKSWQEIGEELKELKKEEETDPDNITYYKEVRQFASDLIWASLG